MKKLLLSVFTIIIFIGCNDKKFFIDEKIVKSIDYYLSKNLNDYSSYEPLEFSILDSVYTNFEDDIDKNLDFYNRKDSISNLITKLNYKIKSINKSDILLTDKQINDIELQNKKLEKSLKDLLKEEEILKKNYVKEFNGYSIKHKFRSKNKLGALVIESIVFHLNTDFVVTHAKTLD